MNSTSEGVPSDCESTDSTLENLALYESMEILEISNFLHAPLSEDEHDIRLFQLWPRNGQDEDPTCKMRTFKLNKCPRFTAISYMWGPREQPSRVQIDGRVLWISRNLRKFFDTLQNPVSPLGSSFSFDPTWLWCDQLCIDQSDKLERNHQVKLMGRIYSTATRTLVWLGPISSDRCPLQQVYLSGINSFEDFAAWESENRWHARTSIEPNCHNTIIVRPQERELVGMQTDELLKTAVLSAYWTRLWIVQEIWFSKEVWFLHGSHLISWASVAAFIENDSETRRYEMSHADWSFSEDLPFVHTLVAEKQRFHGRGEGHRLSYVIERFQYLRCADLRDKVFGLLGLVQDWRRVRVDYSLTPRQLFMEVLTKVVIDEEDLSYQRLLSFARKLSLKLGIPVSEAHEQLYRLLIDSLRADDGATNTSTTESLSTVPRSLHELDMNIAKQDDRSWHKLTKWSRSKIRRLHFG